MENKNRIPSYLPGLAAAAVGFLAFFIAGVPLFQRGPWAASCFLVCGFLFNLGVLLTKLTSPKKGEQAADAVPFPRVSVLKGLAEDVKRLDDRIKGLKDQYDDLNRRLGQICITAGIKPRRPGGDIGAPEPDEKAKGV